MEQSMTQHLLMLMGVAGAHHLLGFGTLTLSEDRIKNMRPKPSLNWGDWAEENTTTAYGGLETLQGSPYGVSSWEKLPPMKQAGVFVPLNAQITFDQPRCLDYPLHLNTTSRIPSDYFSSLAGWDSNKAITARDNSWHKVITQLK